MIKKMKTIKGSAMVLVLIAMSLFLIISTTIMSQINNQIKSNSKIYNEAKYKYKAEGEIDESVSEIYEELDTFIDSIERKYSSKQPLGPKERIEPIKHEEYKEINCHTNGKKKIIANVYDVFREDDRPNKPDILVRTEVHSFDIVGFKNLELASIIDDKYRVTNTVNFKVNNINDNFNLTYEVTSYTKGPIN